MLLKYYFIETQWDLKKSNLYPSHTGHTLSHFPQTWKVSVFVCMCSSVFSVAYIWNTNNRDLILFIWLMWEKNIYWLKSNTGSLLAKSQIISVCKLDAYCILFSIPTFLISTFFNDQKSTQYVFISNRKMENIHDIQMLQQKIYIFVHLYIFVKIS